MSKVSLFSGDTTVSEMKLGFVYCMFTKRVSRTQCWVVPASLLLTENLVLSGTRLAGNLCPCVYLPSFFSPLPNLFPRSLFFKSAGGKVQWEKLHRTGIQFFSPFIIIYASTVRVNMYLLDNNAETTICNPSWFSCDNLACIIDQSTTQFSLSFACTLFFFDLP